MTSSAISMRLRRLSLCVLCAIFAIVGSGCAGGGGGSVNQLLYQTDWTNRGQNVSGLSQRIRIYDDQERLLKTLAINQDADGLQQVAITDIGTGLKHLKVELFSGRDLGGTNTGILDAWINVNDTTTFLSGVGDAPTTVRVTPEAATMQVGTSEQFYAAAYSGPNRATFAAPGTFSWQVFGGVGTVSSTGVVTATATGSGTVRATHDPTGFNGGAALTVEPFQTTQSKWTVMVYMNAANDLSTFSMLNMNQMESVSNVPANVRFVVQWKQVPSLGFQTYFQEANSTRRYLAKPNATAGIDSELIQDMGPGIDMGDPDTLTDFVAWSKTHYPADRYVLVIWNHGNGWLNRSVETAAPTRAVSYDDETGNFIRTHELAQAIGSHIDVLAWDASLMQMLEVAYEVKDQADFVVGSEESPPGEGYPYELIFDDFRDRPDDPTAALTEAFVTGMLSVPGYAHRKITQSSIDTSQLDGLANAVDVLAEKLILHKDAIASVIPTIRANTQSYSESSQMNRHFRDLYHLCLNIEGQLPGFADIVTAAQNVRTALTAAVIHEGHNAQSPNSHGVSIDFSKGADFMLNNNSVDYAMLRFATATDWNEWLEVAP